MEDAGIDTGVVRPESNGGYDLVEWIMILAFPAFLVIGTIVDLIMKAQKKNDKNDNK